MSAIVQTYQLSKSFGTFEAVRQVDMTLHRGEIYGFLGPNGAGKSTVMKMLLNLVLPTEGAIELFGRPLMPGSLEPLKRIGHMIEIPAFYTKLTARQNIELHLEYMGYYKPGAVRECLEMVGLQQAADKPVKTFSLGMKQRLGIARAIAARPELLVLDEPINGLDPSGVQEIRFLFARLRDEYGMTLLISSHILDEIERIADKIGVLDEGRLIREVSMDNVRESQSDYIELTTSEPARAAYILEEQLQLRSFRRMDDRTLRIYDANVQPAQLSKALVMADVPVDSLIRRQHTLQQYFLEVLKGGKGDVESR